MGIILHGTDVSKAKSLDEILGAADLDYDVETRPIFVEGGVEIPGRKAIVRS
jgi:hypothetical protein